MGLRHLSVSSSGFLGCVPTQHDKGLKLPTRGQRTEQTDAQSLVTDRYWVFPYWVLCISQSEQPENEKTIKALKLESYKIGVMCIPGWGWGCWWHRVEGSTSHTARRMTRKFGFLRNLALLPVSECKLTSVWAQAAHCVLFPILSAHECATVSREVNYHLLNWVRIRCEGS